MQIFFFVFLGPSMVQQRTAPNFFFQRTASFRKPSPTPSLVRALWAVFRWLGGIWCRQAWDSWRVGWGWSGSCFQCLEWGCPRGVSVRSPWVWPWPEALSAGIGTRERPWRGLGPSQGRRGGFLFPSPGHSSSLVGLSCINPCWILRTVPDLQQLLS